MSNYARHAWKRLGKVNPLYLLALGVVGGVICLFALRANNEHMLQLRTQLYQTDQSNGDVQTALRNLQQYVVSHMNTNLSTGNSGVYPPIQLQGTYDRLVQARGAALQQQNSQIYTDAQHYCEQQNSVDFSGHNRVPCIEQYVQSHGVKLPTIQDSLYKFNFISPRWSPDLAGWSMLVSGLAFAWGLVLLVVRRLKK
ncbi:MAG TPA: hypothetical protein VFI84_01205 [Candidatus Saccharimonadales bacterium]|nr:hypothetical protein [Candidatus Saccharimonadales bacterium]